ncbi:DNA breaking-rejoining enzyme [Hygrophoropsis aurantiaca]|uniref:DNA breaking-rejoining enzyme n=1 Tax=Hygrophoropsis aurantiaca TaxID=72124 RepID=A0ACB7ZTJ1_9AGAM|nr:DNA breaking-rejoining enzyme [Hygrophoropsis aurantiaca]
MKLCTKFLVDQQLLKPSEVFFTSQPHQHAPWFITAWIMNSCDEIKLDGSLKPKSEYRDSYGHAQKMRAAMTYAFGKIEGLGQMAWQESAPGVWSGNPSVSVAVSGYMCSLRRRKVRAGETAVSARAITPEILAELYHLNHQPENWDIKEWQPGSRKQGEASTWGGGRARRLLGAAYAISFMCLLRFDETLKIQHHDITFIGDNCIKLMLPFRKTAQYGCIEPFYLYVLDEHEAHICPVRALGDWVRASKSNTGYVFRKIMSGDRVSEANVPMTTEQFLELFRNNLLDIRIDPHPYGTHSFRRGGCQYYATHRRWPLRKICEFGGWSQEFSNMTIVKYLISWNDDPTDRREDFLNPAHTPVIKCFACGRSCACS